MKILYEWFRSGSSEGLRPGENTKNESNKWDVEYIPANYKAPKEEKPLPPDFSLTWAPSSSWFAPSTQHLLNVGKKLDAFDKKREEIDYKISSHQVYTLNKISKEVWEDLKNAKDLSWRSLMDLDRSKLADEFIDTHFMEINQTLWNASINAAERARIFANMRSEFFISKQVYISIYTRFTPTSDYPTDSNIPDTWEVKEIDTREEEFDKIRRERLAIENSIHSTQEEYKIAQTEIVTDVAHEETLREIHAKQEYADNQQRLVKEMKDTTRDPWDPEFLSHMSVWSIQSFDYWDDKWVTCTAISGGDFMLQFPDCPDLYIDANWDPKIAEKEIAFYKEVAETPLVRRLLNMETGQFDLFRDRVQSKYDPTGKTRDNPQQLIKIMLEAILGVALAGKDQLWEWVNSIPRGIFSSPNIPLDMIQTAMRYASSTQKMMISYALAEQWVFDTVTRKFSPEIISRI